MYKYFKKSNPNVNGQCTDAQKESMEKDPNFSGLYSFEKIAGKKPKAEKPEIEAPEKSDESK